MTKNLLTAGFITLIIAFLINIFFYIDIENKCVLRVVPSILPSNWDAKQVIQIIKKTAPKDYSFMCENISMINKNQSCGGLDGGCFYSDQKKTIYIGNDQDNIALTSAIVIHELCHARQYKDQKMMTEKECYHAGWEYLKNIQIY